MPRRSGPYPVVPGLSGPSPTAEPGGARPGPGAPDPGDRAGVSALGGLGHLLAGLGAGHAGPGHGGPGATAAGAGGGVVRRTDALATALSGPSRRGRGTRWPRCGGLALAG